MLEDGVIFGSRPLLWNKLELSGDQISPRSSHSATLVAEALVIFGGFSNDQEKSDFCHIKTDTLYCCIAEPTGKVQSKDLGRVGHSAICIGKSIYIFGGWNGQQYCNAGIIYDARSMEISFEESKGLKTDRPAPRRDHACSVVNNNLYLFGGWNCVDQFNDIWRLDSTWKWTSLQCSGSIPAPRRGHTANAMGPYMFVFGGIYGLTHYLGDLFVFNTVTNIWIKVPLKGDPPTPRAWHTANIVGKYLFIIGGTTGRRHFYNDVYALDISTMIWYQVQTAGSIPEPRASHTATLINNQIVVFGGITPSSLENLIYPLNNMFALNVDTVLVESTGFTPGDIQMNESIN